MGIASSLIAPAPSDYRIERVMKAFVLPQNKIEELWKVFLRYDRESKGTVSLDDFFDRLICYPRTGLTDAMCKLIETNNDANLSFGEFTELVVTFSCFEKMELLKYFFFVLDTHKSGLIEKTELKHFIKGIWNNDYTSNVIEALDWLDRSDDGDGVFNFQQILAMQHKYPMIFYPVYRLQVSIIENTLGEYFWENHKAGLMDAKQAIKDKELKALLDREREEEKEKEIVSDEMILKRMGFFRYYLMPWQREIEKARILKIAAIEIELDKAKAERKAYNSST